MYEADPFDAAPADAQALTGGQGRSPRQRGNFWKWLSVSLLAFIAVGLLFVALYVRGNAGTTTALIRDTFGDVLESASGRKLAAEIDLRSVAEEPYASAGTSANPALPPSGNTVHSRLPRAGNATLPNAANSAESPAPDSSVGNDGDVAGAFGAIPAGSSAASPATAGAAAGATAALECAFGLGDVPNHTVLFNEIAWMGSPAKEGESASAASNNEWIELKNNTGGAVNLSGVRVFAATGTFNIVFEDGASVGAGMLFMLERTDDDSAPGAADMLYSGALANGGMWLRLFDRNCILLDEVDASDGWPGGDNATKATLARSKFDLGWYTSGAPGGTPGKENEPPVITASPPSVYPESVCSECTEEAEGPPPPPAPPPPSVGSVVISEVMAGVDGNADYEFVELYNAGVSPVDLTGWSIKKRNSNGVQENLLVSSRLSGKTIPLSTYFLAVNEGGYTGTVVSDATWATSNKLAYENYAVILYNADGEKVDEVAWVEILKGESYERSPVTGSQFVAQPNPNPQNSGV